MKGGGRVGEGGGGGGGGGMGDDWGQDTEND